MASPSTKLKVHIIRAEGLQHMNHFTGDHPYVCCKIKQADGEGETKAETKPVTEGDTLNPTWEETLELESWQPGATLEFIILDKGLLGSKTEGKALLPSEFFNPNGFQGMLAIIGLPDAKLSVEVQIVGAQDGEPSPEQDPGLATSDAEAKENVAVPQRLAVSILQAHGLKHMNNFTGEKPYVTCEVKHLDPLAKTTQVETKPVAEGDTLNPFWGETHDVEPWYEGESLEFTVYDEGLVASKTEGKVLLPSDLFFPQGFSGMVAISGLPHALLHVIVRPLGPSSDASSKKKKKKVKVSKKSKQCC
eukprot:CAMPEP_0172662924 /NCGR_PEP_ID=MMETSP1074-20121228/5620_1 /TAXON_ID=2916 /ORGANISM="Ceratium fusus, Strain PA161109" /LENGTH=304 /DNA_ID=CAMNT_0013478865 /DNA_START=51 /DNA_END=965 /DNA_ORIENTATION=-